MNLEWRERKWNLINSLQIKYLNFDILFFGPYFFTEAQDQIQRLRIFPSTLIQGLEVLRFCLGFIFWDFLILLQKSLKQKIYLFLFKKKHEKFFSRTLISKCLSHVFPSIMQKVRRKNILSKMFSWFFCHQYESQKQNWFEWAFCKNFSSKKFSWENKKNIKPIKFYFLIIFLLGLWQFEKLNFC